MRGPEIRASVGLLYTVAVVDPDHSLGEGLLVENRLDPEQLLPGLEALGEIEGRYHRHRFHRPIEVDGVLRRLHQDLAVLVGDEDARLALLVRGVFATFELGVDDERGLAVAVGTDLIKHPEERQPVFVLGAAFGEYEGGALDHAFALAMHLVPSRFLLVPEDLRSRSPSAPRLRAHPARARPWSRLRQPNARRSPWLWRSPSHRSSGSSPAHPGPRDPDARPSRRPCGWSSRSWRRSSARAAPGGRPARRRACRVHRRSSSRLRPGRRGPAAGTARGLCACRNRAR